MFSFNHPYQTFQVSDQQGLQSYYPDPQQGLQRYYPNLQQGPQSYYPDPQQGLQRYYPNPPQHLQSCDYCTADSYLRPFQGYVQSQSDVQLMRRTEHERSQEFEFAIHGGFVNPFHPESKLACFTQRAVDKTSAIHTLIQQINLKMGRNDEKEGVNGNLEKFICFLKICKIKNDSILVHGSGLRFLCSKVNDIDVVIVSNQPSRVYDWKVQLQSFFQVEINELGVFLKATFPIKIHSEGEEYQINVDLNLFKGLPVDYRMSSRTTVDTGFAFLTINDQVELSQTYEMILNQRYGCMIRSDFMPKNSDDLKKAFKLCERFPATNIDAIKHNLNECCRLHDENVRNQECVVEICEKMKKMYSSILQYIDEEDDCWKRTKEIIGAYQKSKDVKFCLKEGEDTVENISTDVQPCKRAQLFQEECITYRTVLLEGRKKRLEIKSNTDKSSGNDLDKKDKGSKVGDVTLIKSFSSSRRMQKKRDKIELKKNDQHRGLRDELGEIEQKTQKSGKMKTDSSQLISVRDRNQNLFDVLQTNHFYSDSDSDSDKSTLYKSIAEDEQKDPHFKSQTNFESKIEKDNRIRLKTNTKKKGQVEQAEHKVFEYNGKKSVESNVLKENECLGSIEQQVELKSSHFKEIGRLLTTVSKTVRDMYQTLTRYLRLDPERVLAYQTLQLQVLRTNQTHMNSITKCYMDDWLNQKQTVKPKQQPVNPDFSEDIKKDENVKNTKQIKTARESQPSKEVVKNTVTSEGVRESYFRVESFHQNGGNGHKELTEADFEKACFFEQVLKLAVLDSDRYTDAGKALTIEKRERSFAQSRETQRRENLSSSKIEAWSRCRVSKDEFNQRKSIINRHQGINIHQLYEVTAGVMNDQQERV